MGRVGRGGWRWLAGTAALLSPLPALAQEEAPPATTDGQDDRDEERRGEDIVVTGKRPPGSAVGDIAPVAVLDAEAIRAMGVTSINELLKLLKPLTTSNSGADPVFLLNGRRISGYQEIQSLPPEAMERTEILNEQDAARFGFPATVRVVNFVTKKRFRAITVEGGGGTTTDGGGSTARVETGTTRIEGNRRTTLTVNYERQDPLFADQRRYIADSATRFDRIGNLRALDGGSIDPALDRIAGRPVAAAPVPTDPASRGSLAAYAAAGTTRVTDLAPFLSLLTRDQIKVNATHAVPVGRTMTGSINLSMDAQRGFALAGLQGAALRLPAGNPASPFARDVLLDRYLDEAGTLTQRNDALTLHAGSALQGGIGRWMWTVTGGYDRVRVRASVDRGVDPAGVQAAIDAGADPYALGDVVADANRIVSRSRTLTDTTTLKATANGPLLRLPAGQALLTLTADHATSASSGRLGGDAGAATSLARTVRGGSASLDLPLTSADRAVLGAIGTVSANATIGVTGVSEYGSLTSSNLALRWNPWAGLEITASINAAQTPPPIAALTNPVVTVPNTPFFDFVTGASALIPVSGGGNIDLAPEERRIRTFGIGWQPIKGKELRLNLDYVDTRITDQLVYPGSATAALQAAFPDRFVRDADGRLLRADLRPVNLFRERERKITARWSFFTQLGPAPALPGPPQKDAPPPPPPKPRPMLWSFANVTARLDDRLEPGAGRPVLDLLDGETLDGNGGRPAYEVQANIGGSFGPLQLGTYAQWRAATRIRSTIAAADLRFSSLTYAGLYSQLDVGRLVPQAAWAKRLTVQFEVQNLLNARPDVRDRDGVIPYRFQPAFLDPYGRIMKLSLRRMF